MSMTNILKFFLPLYFWGSSSERIKNGELVADNFIYDSETNADWMSVDELSLWVQSNRDKLRIGN